MYTREKQSKQQTHTSTKVYTNMPSFSSTLLDEIYRSIDGNVENSTQHSKKGYKEKPPKITSSRNANSFVVEKWMEQEVTEKVIRDNDMLLFSSTSSSSESSGQLSSISDNADFFGSQKESNGSGLPARPKPVRTGKQDLFDDYQTLQNKSSNDDDLTKSKKSKALKIYSHFKKIKQPISPGMRLTNFINTLFTTSSSGKKARNVETCKESQQKKPSSACSYSRSCKNKCFPKSSEKMKDGIERKVKFHPVSVIIDEDSSRQKCSYNEYDIDRYGKPPLPPNALMELKQHMREKNRRIEEAVQKVLDEYNRRSIDEKVTRKVKQGNTRQRKDESSMFRKTSYEHDEDDYDVMSDSSSDLFELDHLVSYRDNKFGEELPVYETTEFDTRRAIFKGLIR